jgi:DNA-binding CsgD family transcriptional regulator
MKKKNNFKIDNKSYFGKNIRAAFIDPNFLDAIFSNENAIENWYGSESKHTLAEERLCKIYEAMSCLTPRQKQVMSLYLSGKNFTEIAEQLGIDPRSASEAFRCSCKSIKRYLGKVLPQEVLPQIENK